jgi:hypothetical protein
MMRFDLDSESNAPAGDVRCYRYGVNNIALL